MLWSLAFGKVEDGRGSLDYAVTLRFRSRSSNRIVRISRIRLSYWLHREAHPKPVDARTSGSSATGSIDNSPGGFFLH